MCVCCSVCGSVCGSVYCSCVVSCVAARMNQLCIFECLTNGVIRCVLFLLISPAAAASQRHTDVAADMYVRVRVRYNNNRLMAADMYVRVRVRVRIRRGRRHVR